jgi:hypothetical protein
VRLSVRGATNVKKETTMDDMVKTLDKDHLVERVGLMEEQVAGAVEAIQRNLPAIKDSLSDIRCTLQFLARDIRGEMRMPAVK